MVVVLLCVVVCVTNEKLFILNLYQDLLNHNVQFKLLQELYLKQKRGCEASLNYFLNPNSFTIARYLKISFLVK